jgi:hypothetical protein
MKSKNAIIVIALVLFLVVILGVGPVLTIMAMNALFSLNIGVTFWNWLSVVWLSLVLGGICRNPFKFN